MVTCFFQPVSPGPEAQSDGACSRLHVAAVRHALKPGAQ